MMRRNRILFGLRLYKREKGKITAIKPKANKCISIIPSACMSREVMSANHQSNFSEGVRRFCGVKCARQAALVGGVLENCGNKKQALLAAAALAHF